MTSRGIVGLLAVAMVVDTSAYSAITPLLPAFADEYDLSRATAGILTAAYPVGTLVLSLPAALLVARVGPKRVTLAALTILGLASLGFGLADTAPLLILARAIQGIGACGLWSAVLAWTVAVAPPGQRATMLGTVVGAAIFGAVGGPVLGALGDLVGTGVVFGFFVILPAVLIVLVARRPAPPASEAGATGLLTAVRVAASEPSMRTGVWLMTVPALAFGVIYLLVPLRLDDFGLGAAAIGAVFLVAAALESTMSPLAGRVADRRGALTPARLGLALGGAGLLVLALPVGAAPMIVLVIASATVLGMLWTPAMALLAAGSETRGVDPAFGFGLANLAWGLGTTVGGAAGGGLAEAAGDGAPFLVLAVVALATTALLRRGLPAPGVDGDAAGAGAGDELRSRAA